MTDTMLSQFMEADDGGRFAELLKPIRELTKQHCWEWNIAEKLDEYVHYVKDQHIEVNVNGEAMKLDFAKAAMVVQNTVQIYSKKVEYLWILLQEVIEFLSCHGKSDEVEDGTQGLKTRRNARKRYQKDSINLLEEAPLKFRKVHLKLKKSASIQPAKRVQIIPYEILQLEEAIGTSNPLKIKLYTLANEHLGYPSDLRANFHFDQKDFFLQITPKISLIPMEQTSFHSDNVPDDDDEAAPDAMDSTGHDMTPDLDRHHDEAPYEMPPSIAGELQNDLPGHDPSAVVAEDRMQLRSRSTPLPVALGQPEIKPDPWQGLEPYADESIKKKCGTLATTRLPVVLQKRKRKVVGKEPAGDQGLPRIDEFLNGKFAMKKPAGGAGAGKLCQPESEFWEDFVFYTKTVVPAIKKDLRRQSLTAGADDADDTLEPEERANDGHEPDNSFGEDGREDLPLVGGLEDDDDDVEPAAALDRSNRELDESKDFYEILQQQMAEYLATAKAFVSSTESTRRVQAWHDMIRPRLLEAETRRDFDIHQYGSQILSEFGAEAPIGSRTRFSSVVRTLPKNEVARYFLATLQLANAYNVEIASENDSMSPDAIQLKLLSRERHHEHIDEFR